MASTFKSYTTPNVGANEVDVYAPTGVTGVVVGFSLANISNEEITDPAHLPLNPMSLS